MPSAASPRESYVPVDGARLFTRDVGEGPPIVVLHGGPGFSHDYLLPELDRLATSFRLVYYDQRGGGRSADGVEPEDVTIESEVDDLDAIRRHFGLERTAVLGHSWGGLLALEYALRHPDHLSHLILLNTAPASYEDRLLLQAFLRSRRTAAELDEMASLAASSALRSGDLAAEAAYNRLHFRPAFHRPELLEQLVGRLRPDSTPEAVLKARAVEERLYDDTWRSPEYDLRPRLRSLAVPTLALHGDHDFIPVEVAAHIVDAIPGARLDVLPACGHFSYLERPDEVERSIKALFAT